MTARSAPLWRGALSGPCHSFPSVWTRSKSLQELVSSKASGSVARKRFLKLLCQIIAIATQSVNAEPVLICNSCSKVNAHGLIWRQGSKKAMNYFEKRQRRRYLSACLPCCLRRRPVPHMGPVMQALHNVLLLAASGRRAQLIITIYQHVMISVRRFHLEKFPRRSDRKASFRPALVLPLRVSFPLGHFSSLAFDIRGRRG
ncbi:hypothetical protein BDV39DRAFT_124505 [Aspergillus sergii]|uniref:Uncharacterized protein n=1 Tax=Aspergillus sergii TaxID=1034303 RepID=A0A5N6WXI1_9EURO|nr:hypothetical protein BDV39DRAFT_124505 [Aspergillus sergii]